MIGRLRRVAGGFLTVCLVAVALVVGPAVSPALADDENLPFTQQIIGASTLMSAGTAPSAVAVGPDSKLYVTNLNGNSVLAFDQSADGDAAPTSAIFGANTELDLPSGIAVSGTEIFVANNGTDKVTVYNTADNGNVAPSRIITGISAAWGIAVDATYIYVASWPTFGAGAIRVFNKTDSGAATPVHTITTGVDKPVAIAVDGTTMYVANHGTGDITALDMSNNYAVLRSITPGPNNDLYDIYGVAAANGKVYVSNAEGLLGTSPFAINVFDSASSGDVAPLRKIVGGATALDLPKGVAFDVDEAQDPDRHMIYVANSQGYITSYAAGVPEVPSLDSAVGGLDQITLTVTPADAGDSAITGYQYSTDGGTTFVTAPAHTLANPDTFAITTQSTSGTPALVPGTDYSIKVKAVNSNGASAASGTQTASSYTAPSAPVITGITPGNGQLTVAATQASTGGRSITGYEYSTEGADGPWAAAGASLPLTLTQRSDATAFSAGATYPVRIRATNSAAVPQTSASSAPVDGTTQAAGALTFTPTAFSTSNYPQPQAMDTTVTNTGALSATPTAITPAGEGVSLRSGGTCAVGTPIASGGTCVVRLSWTPSAAGTLTGASLSIAYTGGAQPSSSTSLTGTSSKGNQSLTFTSSFGSRTVGGPTYTPTVTGGGSGNPVLLTIAPSSEAVCTVSSGVVSFIGVGSCQILANKAGDANWEAASQVTQTGVVSQGSQTITFPAIAASAMNDSPITLGATASSGLAVSYQSDTPAVCTVSGSDVTLLSVGACTITASQAGNANYSAASSQQQAFAVAQGSQSITFPEIATTAIDVGPVALTATASSGLAVAYAETTPSVCTVTGSLVNLIGEGDCTIEADQAGDANWSPAATVARTFTVTATGANPTPDAGAGVAQTAVGGCVTAGKSPVLPRRGTKRLMKAGCEGTSGEKIAVKVSRVTPRSATARGDQRYYSLYCLVKAGTKTKVAKTVASGYGPGLRACARGELRIRTYGMNARMTVEWFAPAVDGYAAFSTKKRFRS